MHSTPQPLSLEPLRAEPLVSVIMPSYNYERFIERAITSVLEQTYERLELVICDDGSTDRSPDIARRFAIRDARVRLIEQPNGGVSSALNAAYRAASGQIVCLIDADDFFEPGKLSAILRIFQQREDTGFVLHAMQVVDGSGIPLYIIPRSGHFEEGWIADRLIRRGGRWRNMPASALCFRREVVELLFPLPAEHLRSMADAYLYMLAPLLTRVAFIEQPLSGYRLHGNNLTGTLHFDLAQAHKFTQGVEQVHASIAQAACPGLFDRMPLRLEDHLTYQEQQFLKRLFEGGHIGDLLKGYLALVRRLRSDDLYGKARKWIGIVANGIALVLPRRWRPAWITWMLNARWRELR